MPKRKIKLKFPWLSPDEITVELLKWLVAEGDAIEIDQNLAEFTINGETFLLPSPLDGVLLEILAEPGAVVEQEETLGVILSEY